MMSIGLRNIVSAALLTIGVVAVPASYAASVDGMNFVGGCSGCGNGGNADVESVAAILGVDAELVTYLGEVTSSSDGDVVGINSKSGDWDVDNGDITHLAWKGSTFFILGELTADNGSWSMDVRDWSPDFDTVACPAEICAGERFYELGDFRNGGGRIPGLSNVRAFSVVPLPAAVWLFGCALGVLGWIRRSMR